MLIMQMIELVILMANWGAHGYQEQLMGA